MADDSLLMVLSAETRSKLRSTQILTSLPSMVSELLQNAIDAGASQIDIGVDCAEWSCWVMDNGSGFTRDGLHKIGQNSERGRYNSSKAFTPASLGEVSTFGFRGEALASMGDLSCMEISSRTTRSRESWSVIVKAGRSLYIGPSIRWRRESPGTTVSIRDAFFNLPVRRQSHPTPNKTIELIRQELETYALVSPNISFSFQDGSKIKESHHPHKSHVLKIPKTRSSLAVFRHLYGRAFTEESCVEEIAATSDQLRIEGFISLVGAYTKAYQFLYINRHPISFCDLHRLIDNRFAASTFAKHAYDEGGETSMRSPARRSPRKGERKPVYVLNLIIPMRHIDNCLEPSKSVVELDNKNDVTSFLSATIHSFLAHHNFTPDKRRDENAEDNTPKKKRKLIPEGLADLKTPSDLVQPEKSGTPDSPDHAMPVVNAQGMVWEDLSPGEIMNNHTDNSYPQSARFTVGADASIKGSSTRRIWTTHLSTEENNYSKNFNGGDHMPDWLREALQANDAFALQEPKIPSFPQLVNQGTNCRSSQLHHECRADCFAPQATSSRCPQRDSSSFVPSQIRFQKDDLRKAQIISQVDCKFIACVIGLEHDDSPGAGNDNGIRHDEMEDGKMLILIDQHAADERVRVERFLKSICRGFLSHQEGSGGVEAMELSPPIPVLLTRQEASRLAELLSFQQAFESWGFQFTGLEETRSRVECETEPDDGGYVQVFVRAIPQIVSEKLLLGKEMQELIRGHIGALESRELEPRDVSSHSTTSDEAQWLKALRWCPRGLLDLINSKACRGAIMFNDPLSIEQCERLVKQLSATVFPFQCAHGRPSLVPLTRLASKRVGGPKGTGLEWENVAAL